MGTAGFGPSASLLGFAGAGNHRWQHLHTKERDVAIVQSALAFLAVTLVGVVAGGGGAWFQARQSTRELVASAPVCEGATPGKVQLSDAASTLIEIPTIITNLAGENAPWVRLEVSVVLPAGFADKTRVAAQLAQDFLGHVRTLQSMQLAGGTNLHYFREELREIARIRTSQDSLDVLIKTLVIE